MDSEETRVTRHRNNHDHKQPTPKKRHWMRWVIGVIIVLLLGAAGYEYHKLHSTATGIFGNSTRVRLKTT